MHLAAKNSNEQTTRPHSRVESSLHAKRTVRAPGLEPREAINSLAENTAITFLRLPQVKAATGLSKTTIYEKIKENAFPCPVLISKRAVAWIESEVRQWAATQVSAARTIDTRLPPKGVSFSRPRLRIAKTA
jgi:prophage regulatory protein